MCTTLLVFCYWTAKPLLKNMNAKYSRGGGGGGVERGGRFIVFNLCLYLIDENIQLMKTIKSFSKKLKKLFISKY